MMYDHANRFRAELRDQLEEFFGEQVEKGTSERELLRRYRENLKTKCALQYAADLRVSHPTSERTHFRLVVGGKDKKVLEVFRDVERDVMGRTAGRVRDAARRRAEAARTGVHQLGVFDRVAAVELADGGYAEQHQTDLANVMRAVFERLSKAGRVRFEKLWPSLLEEHHVAVSELARAIGVEVRDGRIAVAGWSRRQQLVKDGDVLSLAGATLDPRDPK